MENKNWYAFIGKIALNYRLSLKNICRLLGKDSDESTKMEIYELIMSTAGGVDMRDAYNFLFNYETVREDDNSSSLALFKAITYLRRYSKARKDNDKDMLKLLERELTKIDEDFRKFKQKQKIEHFSEEDITIISKYRLKYCISRLQMSKLLGVNHKMIADNENKITDAKLREKINLISSFYQDLSVSHRRYK